MTKREILETITNGEVNEEIMAWAAEEIVKLDERNAKSRERAALKAKENEPLFAQIREMLTDEPQPASAFAEAMGVSTAKVSALFRKMDETEITVTKIKNGKSKVNGYAKAEVE